MVDRPPVLSAEALAALTAYRKATPMPKAARERVHARLSAAPAPSRRGWLWAAGSAIAAGLLVWGAIGVSDALQATTDAGREGSLAPMQAPPTAADTAANQPVQGAQPPPRSRVKPSNDLAPVPLETLETTEPPETPETAATAPPRTKRRTKPLPEAAPAPAIPPSRLGVENELIARTWQQVRSQQYAKARTTLAEHASEFPAGVLAPERRALEVIVACMEHPKAAPGKADAYAAQGHSTLLAKVRSACKQENPAPR